MKNSIFLDKTGMRWFYFCTFMLYFFAVIILLFSFFIKVIFTKSKLSTPNLEETGKGEILQVDENGNLKQWGYQPKKLVLTFDDGPDKENTPKILNILKKHYVKATFFVVGANANQNPQILKRIYNEGHEIGNHTYNHFNSTRLSDDLYKLEINTTERLFESQLGIKPILFRAPYASDEHPQSKDELDLIQKSSELGYFTVGMNINPQDWKNLHASTIASLVIEDARKQKGNVILLHDAGEDRSQTIEALPKIITTLKQDGYEFTTVGGLLGLDRSEVMPPVTYSSVQRITTAAGFIGINFFQKAIVAVTAITAIIGTARFIFIATLALLEKIRPKRFNNFINYFPKVAAIVPAYNEERVVNKTVESLVRSDYLNLEILVIDDGSVDRTYQTVKEHYGKNSRITNLKIENGGKSSAINYGLSQTDAEIVILLDADTIIAPDAISKLVRHFSDPKVGAVAGNAKVGNQINLLTRLQAVEYITSQNLERRAFALINCIRVVPGAIGAWRKQLLIKTGGFKSDTLAEDTDMTLSILRLGYKVSYDPDSLGYTEAPDTIKGFLKQRYRWMHGTLQAIWKHMDIFFKPKYGALAFFTIPDVIIFQVIFPLFAPLMDILLVSNIIGTVFQIIHHPESFSTEALSQAFGYYIVFLFFDYIAAVSAFILDEEDDLTLLGWFFIQRFFYRQLLYITAIRSTLSAIRGKPVGWGKLERKSTVEITQALSY